MLNPFFFSPFGILLGYIPKPYVHFDVATFTIAFYLETGAWEYTTNKIWAVEHD